MLIIIRTKGLKMDNKRLIEILDSTLRDGAQGEGISYSVRDKLLILKALDCFGVDYIEAGNPGSNPKDTDFFARAREVSMKSAKLCAFGATHRKNIRPEDDPAMVSLANSSADCAVIFGKAHELHVERVLCITAEDNIELVHSSIAYQKAHVPEVIFDAEHFFDGYEYKKDHAMAVIDAAFKAGADCVTLCDTNGGTLPDRIYEITKEVCDKYPDKRIGIHTHDDAGLAVANAMSAVKAGATLVQGTFTGIGERCGNCDLSVLIPNLILKWGMKCGKDGVNLTSLMETARRISDISNIATRPTKPYTGKSAFAHKGGMHIDATEKLEGSYEHISPSLVGNKRRILLSEVSGRGAVTELAKQVIPDLDRASPEAALITEKLKSLEHEGYQFEAADASFELLIRKTVGDYKPHFNVVLYKTTDDFPSSGGKLQASAMVQVEVGGLTETAASLGNGPVNALDAALKRALTAFYPVLGDVTLTDFKVRVLEANSTTAAKVRVLIESTDSRKVWTTVGVSHDIIEASFMALADALEYKLYMNDEI